MQNASAFGVVAGGYTSLTPVDGDDFTHVFGASLVFNGTVPQAQAALAALGDWAAAHAADVRVVQADVMPYASLVAWHDTFPEPEPTGYPVTLGSRLLPLAALSDEKRRGQLVASLATVASFVVLEMFHVAGGAVSAYDPGRNGETSLNPAWRGAALHAVFGASWALNATLEEQASLAAGVSDLTGVLRSALPESGAYWSESDILEPDWQRAFWGANYARLQAAKREYDPSGTFTCWHCVELAA